MATKRGKNGLLQGARWESFVLILTIVSIVLFTIGAHSAFSTAATEGEASPQRLSQRVLGGFETGIARAEPLLIRYGYPAVFLAIFVEGFGILAPGQTLLMAAAVESARGEMNIVWVMLSALAAATFGNLIGYLIGRWGGRAILARIRVNEKHLVKVEAYFTRRGAALLLFARFFDGLRQLNGIAAGFLGMSWHRFLVLNTVGAVFWTAVWGVGVYLLGRHLILLHHRYIGIQPITLVVSLAGAASIVFYLLWHRSRRGDAPRT